MVDGEVRSLNMVAAMGSGPAPGGFVKPGDNRLPVLSSLKVPALQEFGSEDVFLRKKKKSLGENRL